MAPRQSSRATKAPTKFSPPASTVNPRKRASDSQEDKPAVKKARASTAKTTKAPAKKATGVSKSSATTKSKATAKAVASKVASTTKNATAKKTAAASAAAPKKTKSAGAAKPKANMAVKRKAADEPARSAPVKRVKPLPEINTIPTEIFDVFVNGEGGMGELGLGTSMKAIDVKRPRLNSHLTADAAGVVKIAVGGMHCVAITHDNKVLTWGVNDQGALGRETEWSGGLVSIDEASNQEEKEPKDTDSDTDSDDDNGLNPKEAVPTAIPSESFPEEVKFVDCAAGDSVSFVLTSTGLVYGWGVFRGNNGPIGFNTANQQPQRTPVLIDGLKNVKKVVCGANHVFALDKSGTAYGWGSGEQHQLGRKLVERTSGKALRPSQLPLPQKQVRDIFTGSDHGFAINKKNEIFSWGINSFCETGHENKQLGDQDMDTIVPPKKVTSLAGQNILYMEGGNHHTVAVNDQGECLTWGCADSGIPGVKLEDIPADKCIVNDAGVKRIVLSPITVGVKDVVHVAAGTEHSIALTKDGKAYTWGFSTAYQTAQGTTEDIVEATMVDNNAVRERKLVAAGAGGQFSVFGGLPAES